MPRKIALLFSGQGAQQVGMGRDLANHYAVAANLFAQADRLLNRPLSQLAFDGPTEELTRTRNCQLALYVHGLAVLRVLEEEAGPLCLKVAFASLRALRRIFCTPGKSALLIKTFSNFRRNKFHIGRFPNR